MLRKAITGPVYTGLFLAEEAWNLAMWIVTLGSGQILTILKIKSGSEY